MDSQRQILDELMGKNRNLPLSELKKRNETYSDDPVCKNWLICMCFNDLFPNTPHDEGTCTKRHDPIFKYQFENDDSINRFKHEKHFINDAIFYIESKIQEVDSKIKSKRQQLEGNNTLPEYELPKELTERIETFEQEIKKLLQHSALMGEQGNLEESEQLAEEAEKLRLQKDEAIRANENPNLARDQKVCDVCGAFQASNDTEKRQQTHLEGKIHQGFKLLRSELERLKKRKDEIKTIIDNKKKEEDSRSRSRSKGRKSKKNKKSKKHKKTSSSSSRSKSKTKKHKSKKNKQKKSASSD